LQGAKKVLFITYDGLTDPLGQSQILPYFKGLSKLGHSITILSCEKPNIYPTKAELIKTICKESKIDWKFVYYTKKPPILSTISDLNKMEKKALELHKKKAFDIVHCRTVVPSGIALKLQKEGVKFIFDIRGFWTDERVDGRLWNLNNPLYKLIYHHFKTKEKKAYKGANHIITLTQNAKNELIKSFRINANIIDTVPCTVDLNHFKLTKEIIDKSEQLKEEFKITRNTPVVCYAGSLGTRYMIHEMLSCFKTIQTKYSKAIFLIVTHSDTEDLKELSNQLEIKESIRITSTSYQSIPAFIALADLALYFIYVGKSGKAVSPTKQAEFLSLGVPIITNDGIGDSSDIIGKNNVGLIVSDFNEQAYQNVSEQISKLMNKPSDEIINIAEQYFSLEKGLETYNSVYNRIS